MRDETAPDLSIVLPCFRAAALASRSIEQLLAFLNDGALSFEIIVVDDGGGDFDGWVAPDDRVHLIPLSTNRGKGAAIRAGMLHARGRARIFTDVDLPFDLELFPLMANYMGAGGFHVVVGDRTLPGSSYLLDVGRQRRMASQLFSFFVGKVVTGGFYDTQCGLKGFRGDVADALFRLTRIDRFACDVELIYLALIHRLDIKRVPVQLRRNDTSSVRVFRDSFRMLGDVLRLKLLRMRGAYDSRALQEIPLHDYRQRRAEVLAEDGSFARQSSR